MPLLKFIFKTNSPRIINIQKNILGLFFLKAINIGVTFLSLPIILGYLDITNYGIWLTISSIIGWAGFFDLGLSNGLRNPLGKSITDNNRLESKKIVSTTFFLLLMIIIPIYFIFLLGLPFFKWTSILNSPANYETEIKILIFWVFNFFCIRFITGLIFTILSVDHKSALSDLLNTFANILNLVLFIFLKKYTSNSLFYVGFYTSLIMTVVPVAATLWYFKNDYSYLSPSYKYFDKLKLNVLLNQGFGFFFIQISALILFSTDNMIITQLFTPADVVPYNIAYRLFNFTTLLFGIVLTPFWAAYTEAYHQKNTEWIVATTKKLLYIFIIFILGVLILLSISDILYKFWLGSKIYIPFKISLFMSFFVIVQSFNMIFVTFIFSTGKIKIQMYLAIFAAFINIPLSIFFSKYLNFGPSGVILATTICGLTNFYFGPIQFIKLIKGTASGLWNK